jgi:hypothetical protein
LIENHHGQAFGFDFCGIGNRKVSLHSFCVTPVSSAAGQKCKRGYSKMTAECDCGDSCPIRLLT